MTVSNLLCGVMVFDVVHSTLSGEKWHNTLLPLVGFEPSTFSVVAQTANHYIHHQGTHTHKTNSVMNILKTFLRKPQKNDAVELYIKKRSKIKISTQ